MVGHIGILAIRADGDIIWVGCICSTWTRIEWRIWGDEAITGQVVSDCGFIGIISGQGQNGGADARLAGSAVDIHCFSSPSFIDGEWEIRRHAEIARVYTAKR